MTTKKTQPARTTDDPSNSFQEDPSGDVCIAIASGKGRTAHSGKGGVAIGENGAEAFADPNGVSFVSGPGSIANGSQLSVSIAGTASLANTGGAGGIAINLGTGPNPGPPTVSEAVGGAQCIAIAQKHGRARVQERSIAILMNERPGPNIDASAGLVSAGENSIVVVGYYAADGQLRLKIGIVGADTTVDVAEQRLVAGKFYAVDAQGNFLQRGGTKKVAASRSKSKRIKK